MSKIISCHGCKEYMNPQSTHVCIKYDKNNRGFVDCIRSVVLKPGLEQERIKINCEIDILNRKIESLEKESRVLICLDKHTGFTSINQFLNTTPTLRITDNDSSETMKEMLFLRSYWQEMTGCELCKSDVSITTEPENS